MSTSDKWGPVNYPTARRNADMWLEHANGVSCASIARRYKLSRGRVAEIVTKRTLEISAAMQRGVTALQHRKGSFTHAVREVCKLCGQHVPARKSAKRLIP